MKRYSRVFATGNVITDIEDPNGDWVKYEDVKPLLKVLKKADDYIREKFVLTMMRSQSIVDIYNLNEDKPLMELNDAVCDVL